MKAILFVGGWEGHNPSDFADWCSNLLYNENFKVNIYDTLEPLEQPERLAEADVIIPIWSSARSSHKPEFGNMTKKQIIMFAGKGAVCTRLRAVILYERKILL